MKPLLKRVFIISILFLNYVLTSNLFQEVDIDLGLAAGLTKESKISFDVLQKTLSGVKAGNKNSIYFYGLLKLYGLGVNKNPTDAAELFRKSSDLGHVEATTAYGMCLMTGNGIPQNDIEAAYWFRKGVEMNDVNAHWLLGRYFILIHFH